MKRIICLFAAMLLLLSGCAGGGGSATVTRGGNDDFTATGQKVESSIFGRNIKYNAFTPAEGLALPVSSDEITDMAQIEKRLYFLTDGALYTLDIGSGESGKLLDTDAKMFAAHGGSLYTYAPESGGLCEYSAEGELISEKSLTIQGDDLTVEKMLVTDGYFSFVCWNRSEDMAFMQHRVFDRDTLEEVNTVDEKKSASTTERIFGAYKGNSILRAEESSMDSRSVDISEINLETGKSVDLAEASVDCIDCVFDFAYSPKTDTVLFFTAPSGEGGSAMEISEYSLSDPDNIVHKRFYADGSAGAYVFVSVYENIISAISGGEYRYFDYLDPPESITLACQRAERYEDIIFAFEKETGIMVRTVSYGLDINRLDIKLMAGDTDFDLFEPVFLYQHKYFLSGMFEDLSKYDGIKRRLDGNLAASYVSSLDGKYIGIPTDIRSMGTKEVYPEDGSMWTYSNAISRFLYLAQNIDVADGVYKDADGKELYKLLRYLYDNPSGNESEMPFGKEINLLSNGFILMNPSSAHKDNSVKFLEYMFDVLNGDIAGVLPESRQYISLDSTDDIYLYWRIYAWDYVEPIYNAANSVSQSDGKSSTLKSLAREAAAEVAMRIGE